MSAPTRRRGLAAACQGAVAVEFALLAPVMVVLLLGVIGLAQTMTAANKVQQATATIADLVTQSREVDTAALEAIVTAGRQILYPFPAGAALFGGRVICVRFDGTPPAVTARALWTYSFGDQPGTSPDLSRFTGLAQPEIDVIVVSVEYRHELAVPSPVFNSLTIRELAVSRPRVTKTVERK